MRRNKSTMLPGLDRPLCVLVVSLVRCPDDDEFNLRISHDLVDGVVDLDTVRSFRTKPCLELSARFLRLALEDTVKFEELGQC
jgi:hypothetical protein